MRKRVLLGVCLALITALAWVAAPALSLRPYIPGAVDFERGDPGRQADVCPGGRSPPPAPAHPRERAPRWISPPVKAPHRFDLVGVAREMRALQIRVRDDSGRWSDWVDQEDGTPIYVGGADYAQVRAPFRPRRAAPLRERLRDRGQLRRPAGQLRAERDQHRLPLRRVDARRPGDRPEAARRQPRGLGGRPAERRLPAARAARVRHRAGGCHPPHGERQRLHARRGPLDRSRHLPVPRLRQRLERHRLQRARRPLRDALRGPRRRSQATGGRRPGTGLQLPDDLDRLDRRPHQRGTHTAGAALDHPVPGLEDGDQPRLLRSPAPSS